MPRLNQVTVLMTVYNTKFSYVKRAIDSVLRQDFQEFELIIIDDGSSRENREALMHAIVAMRYQLSQFEIMLQSEISVGLESMFESVGKWREDLMS